MKPIVLILIAAAFGVALGKALDLAPIPLWVQWSILATILFVSVLFIRGTIVL